MKAKPRFEKELREREQKPALSLIPTQALMEVGRVFAFANKKYKPNLWREETVPYSERVSSALRHILAWNEGEDLDPQSGISHLAHAVTQLMFLMEYQKMHPEEDDRWKKSS